jgi:hypothetical protein
VMRERERQRITNSLFSSVCYFSVPYVKLSFSSFYLLIGGPCIRNLYIKIFELENV